MSLRHTALPPREEITVKSRLYNVLSAGAVTDCSKRTRLINQKEGETPMASVKRNNQDDVISVDEEALCDIALKRSKLQLISGDWAERSGNYGTGFEDSELQKLTKDVEQARNAFYFALLSLKTAEYLIKNPPSPP